MSTIKVNAIQHSGGNNVAMSLASNGNVVFANNVTVTGKINANNTTSVDNVAVSSTSTNSYITVTSSAGGGSMIMQAFQGTLGTLGSTNNIPVEFITNSVRRMYIDTNGYVTMPYLPAFYAQGSGTQSWSGAQTTTKVDFSTGGQYVTANKSGGWSSVNSRFTAPVAGTYEFVLTFALSSGPTTGPAAILYKNGSSIIEVCIGYFSTTYCQCTGNMFVDLAVGDYAEFWISNYNATTFTIDRGRCHFSGRLIG